jgi:rod shape-determining protein MreC
VRPFSTTAPLSFPGTSVRLRQLVDFPMPAAQRSVVARVVTREPGSWFQWVIIDRGRAEGLFVIAPVLAWAGDKPAVLGRVGEVFDHSAKVVLITSVISSLPVKVTSCEQDGLMEGQNNTRMKLNYLLPESKITIGDEVVTSSLSTVFPPGIRVGYIHDYMGNESDAYRSAVVKPAVNFNSLREVAVLIPENR